MKKIFIIFFIFIILNSVHATDFGVNNYIDTLNSYTDTINLDSVYNNLRDGKLFDYSNILNGIVDIFFKEIIVGLKGGITIFILVVIIGILKSLELEQDSSIIKIGNLVLYILISIILVTTFKEVITMFSNTCITVTSIMEIVSPFLMGILIGTGSIVTVGIVSPLILFVTALVGFLITSVIVPLIILSIIFSVINSLNEKIRLDKVSKLFRNSSIFIIGILFTIFLGVLSIQTSITTSVDSLTIKTMSTAVSNFVPVVGKFFSDSFETVVGATEVVGKVGGTIGIIAITLTMFIPIIKLIAITVVYYILAAICETISDDDKVIKIITSFADTYKIMVGVLIGVFMLFVISLAIIINITGSVVS